MNGNPRRALSLLVLLVISLSPLALRADDVAANPLKSVKTFMYQLDGLDKPANVDRLAASGYDMLIVEPTFNIKGSQDFNARAMVKSLHDARPGRIVLAYLNIGDAEQFRTYWTAEWRGQAPMRPGYLLGPDPEGDRDTFLVRFWRPRWQGLFLNRGAVLDKLMADGFDGVCLDGIDAYDQDAMDAPSNREKIDPAAAMVTFVTAIRDHIRKANPSALVVCQDAAYLIDDEPKFARVIDGIAFEDTWYSGKDKAAWNASDAGDVPNTSADDDSSGNLVRQYHKYLSAGVPVFTIDYCVDPARAHKVYRESAAQGFVPLVTRVSVDHLTPTPPPDLAATQP